MSGDDFFAGVMGILILLSLVLWVLILPLHTNYISYCIKEQGTFENKRGDYFIRGTLYKQTLEGSIEIKAGDSF